MNGSQSTLLCIMQFVVAMAAAESPPSDSELLF